MFIFSKKKRAAVSALRTAFSTARDGAERLQKNYNFAKNYTVARMHQDFGVVESTECNIPENTFSLRNQASIPYQLADEAMQQVELVPWSDDSFESYLRTIAETAQGFLSYSLQEKQSNDSASHAAYQEVSRRFHHNSVKKFVLEDTAKDESWGFAYLPSAVLRVWLGKYDMLLPVLAAYVQSFDYEKFSEESAIVSNCGDESVFDISLLIAFDEMMRSMEQYEEMPWDWIAPMLSEQLYTCFDHSTTLKQFYDALHMVRKVPKRM